MSARSVLFLVGLLCGGSAAAFVTLSPPTRTRDRIQASLNEEEPTVVQAVADSVASTVAAAAHLGAWAASETLGALGTGQPTHTWFTAFGTGLRAGAKAFSATIRNSTIVDVSFTSSAPSDNAQAATEAKSIARALSRVRAASPLPYPTLTAGSSPAARIPERASASQRSTRTATGLSVAAQREKEMLLRGPHSPLYYAESDYGI